MAAVTLPMGAENVTSPEDPEGKILWPVLYALIFVPGLLLNCTALWIFCSMDGRSSFTLYLKNVAFADLLMTLTFPINIMKEAHLGPWWVPVLHCRYMAVLFYTCMYVSILFLGLLSLDRYLKIVRPFGSSCLYSYGFTLGLSVSVWVGIAALSLPNTILTEWPSSSANISNCMELKNDQAKMWHRVVNYINLVLFMSVLVVLMSSYMTIYWHVHRSNAQFVSSTNGRKLQPSQNITIVLVVFFLCFVPYHVLRVPFTHSQVDRTFSPWVKQALAHGKSATLFLSACNVCLDPIIYFLMCRSFKHRLRRKLCSTCAVLFDPSSNSSRTQVRRFREYAPPAE